MDAALAQVKAKNKYLQLFFKERTFHSGCQSQFVPSYVPKEAGYSNSRACFAKIWQKATMDHMIRVLQNVALRYKNDPNFLGVSLPETANSALSMKGHPEVVGAYYDQLKRVYPAVHSVGTNLIVHQLMNWPNLKYPNALYEMSDTLVGIGGGGAMGWPDTVPESANQWSWYKVGRDYNKRLAVMPHVQTALVGASLNETEQIYNFLNNDIRAHMIVWATWHPDKGGAYLTDVVIPTVNKHVGRINNTVCPW